MGDPLQALPSISVDQIQILLTEINFPPATNIEIPRTAAAYHIIAFLQFTDETDKVLRIAGPHVPKVKTENEVSVIAWLQRNTNIPVPPVIRYDSSTKNALGCEYVLQERIKGQSLDLIWPDLSKDERLGVFDVAADCLRELNAHEWGHIGGLRMEGEDFLPGPVLDERFWEQRDIETLFPNETQASLNPLGPYSSYVDFSIARLEKYTHSVRTHPSLEFMREHIPLTSTFIHSLRKSSALLNQTKLRLSHRDLHMGNIMYDRSEKKVTGILDWEFSIVMPLQQGDISRAFLHDLQSGGDWAERKRRQLEVIRQRCEERGFNVLDDYAYTSEHQKAMQNAVDLLRAIVEVSPRGQRVVEKMVWKDELLEIMRAWV